MRLKGFIGAAYNNLKSSNIDAEKCINLYPQMIESGLGKEGEVAALLSTPGLIELGTVGNGPIRLKWQDPRGTVFIASGNKIYTYAFSGSSWSATELGTLNTSEGTMKAASTKLDNGDTITVFVDGTDSYTYERISGVETFDDYAGRSYSQVDGATSVFWIDGFFIFIDGSSRFYASEWGSFSVDPLDFASAEGDPDNIKAIMSNHRDLWLVGENSTEVWVNTGNPKFPFERAGGGFIEIGIIAPNSLDKIEGFNFWLGRDKSGFGKVYIAQGTTVQRISTHPIEQAISSYDIDSITTADAYTYARDGHSFYVLNFPEATWVYDLTTKQWHERAYNDSGTLTRHRANHCLFVQAQNVHLLGDYENNKIYQFSDTTYADGTAALIRRRTCPAISAGGKTIFHKSLTIEMEVGVGLSGGVQGSDPVLMLRFSDDGGKTWSNEMTESIGKIGEYTKKVQFTQLGSSTNRIYEVSVSDPVKVVFTGAEIDLEVGAH